MSDFFKHMHVGITKPDYDALFGEVEAHIPTHKHNLSIGYRLDRPLRASDCESVSIKVHDFAKLEARMIAQQDAMWGNTSSAQVIAGINQATEELYLKTPNKREPDMSLQITRPVLVGNTDILTASDAALTRIIRQANNQIENDADMAKISTNFRKREEELREVIKLCVEQLDKK